MTRLCYAYGAIDHENLPKIAMRRHRVGVYPNYMPEIECDETPDYKS